MTLIIPHEQPLLTRSRYAVMIDHPRDVADRTERVFGTVIHTTGKTIAERAVRRGIDPFEFALGYYADPKNYAAQYVIAYDGTIAQVADERERMSHTGMLDQLQSYMSGKWVNELPASLVRRWRARHPGMKSPLDLFPGTSVNNVFVGIEHLPIVKGCGHSPMGDGLLYTTMQHESSRVLVMDIARRWRFDFRARTFTHSELNPITRHDRNGGWDIGVLRAKPKFDWSYLMR